MSEIIDSLRKRDAVLLDYLEKRWCSVEMVGCEFDEDGYDMCEWNVTPDRYNPAVTGEGGTLREAIENAIRRNGGEEDKR